MYMCGKGPYMNYSLGAVMGHLPDASNLAFLMADDVKGVHWEWERWQGTWRALWEVLPLAAAPGN